jgi:hypothetical protein
MSQDDWLSCLLQMITVTGQVEVRCTYGAPWRVAWPQAAAHEIPYHVVLNGRAFIEDPERGRPGSWPVAISCCCPTAQHTSCTMAADVHLGVLTITTARRD